MMIMENKGEEFDVFISYRRQGGGTVAALLYHELDARGLRVFMDTQKLKSGDYEQAILNNIKSAANFILLVSDGVFESKNVVWEVENALSLAGKNIIPVFINNNNAFKNTPEKIKAIEKQNGIVLNHLNPKNSINYLLEQITSRADNLVDRITQVFDIDSIHSILDDCKEIDEEIEDEIITLVTQRIKSKVKIINKDKSNLFFTALFGSIYYTHAKEIAKELGFEYRGSKKRVFEESIRWIREGGNYKTSINSKKNEDDRLDELMKSFVFYFSSRYGTSYLIDIFEKNDLEKPKTSRKSDEKSSDYIKSLFRYYDDNLRDIFSVLELTEEDVKNIAHKIFGENSPKKRKNELIAHIISWVDYEL